jgi:hypothetical protein
MGAQLHQMYEEVERSPMNEAWKGQTWESQKLEASKR